MTLKKVTDAIEALQLIEDLKRGYSLSNCFLMGAELERLSHEGLLWYEVDASNAFFLEDKGNCFRIHYIINDKDRKFPVVVDKPLMLEILFRGKDGEPKTEVAYWESQGFSRNLVRNNYAAKYSELRLQSSDYNHNIHIAETIEDSQFAQSLFNNVFDPYSGDFINSDEIVKLLHDRKILIATSNGKAAAALHFYNVGKCAWIGHVAVLPKAQGRGLGSALVSEFIRENHVDDKSRYSLWVQSQNQAAVAMYGRFGFKYTGKSTLSMMKEQL